jgi:8-oxo-dGTP pyrophosphatase MutT (NUDIX family)
VDEPVLARAHIAPNITRPAFHPKSQLLTARTERGIHPNSRPRDAATLILVDDSESGPKLLMGQRHMNHRFMPGKFVFPGGRVEPKDYAAPESFPLSASITARLLRWSKGGPHPGRARALVNAALRETREETGLVVGANDEGAPASRLTFLARAITPPGRPRRFDTRFFVLPATMIAERTEVVDGEFSAISWLSLAEAREANLPLITRVILDELEERLLSGTLADQEVRAPFYFKRGACFHRLLL